MAFLNNLLYSDESLALRLESDERSFEKSWQAYIGTVDEKNKLADQLPYSFGQRKVPLLRLKQLLDLELADTNIEEQEEKDMIKKLESLEHSKKIKRVHRLEDCLKYMETRHEYVHALLRRIYLALRLEANVIGKLLKCSDLRKYRSLVKSLRSELEIEKELLKKISAIETFRDILAALVKGEHKIQKLDADEKILLKQMEKTMAKIFSKKIREGIIYTWARTMLEAIDEKIEEGIAYGSLDDHHDVDLEFVNSPSFVLLAKEVIDYYDKSVGTDQLVNVFVHLFREWFNHERD